MKKLLLATELPEEAIQRLNQVFDVTIIPKNDISASSLLRGAVGAQAVICDPSVKLEAPIIEVLAPTCNIISVCGNEYLNIDMEAVAKTKILVCTSDRVVSDSMADMIFALIFASGRKVVKGNDYVRLGRFNGLCPNNLLGDDISLQTLGMVGAGTLSKAVCARAKAFNMKVLYASENEDTELDKMKAKRVSLDDLFAFSDYITLHGEYAVSANNYNLMKNNSILINAVSADLVDEEALVNAFAQGKLNGAALDVCSKELAKKLAGYDNCILTPHMGSATVKKHTLMINDAIKNVLDYFDGKMPQDIINNK